ncbi:acyl carrier protein [Streptomyces exfoliatus]|uniref:acyl carrier protein n=1 Tax=Streptomyces exfoliatus TaxID=1905 RepID=UPI003C2F71D1
MTTTTVNIEDLRTLIAGALETEPEEVTDEAHFTDELEIDSLMLLEISTRIENTYGIPVDDVIVSGVHTLVELHTLIAAKVAEPSA